MTVFPSSSALGSPLSSPEIETQQGSNLYTKRKARVFGVELLLLVHDTERLTRMATTPSPFDPEHMSISLAIVKRETEIDFATPEKKRVLVPTLHEARPTTPAQPLSSEAMHACKEGSKIKGEMLDSDFIQDLKILNFKAEEHWVDISPGLVLPTIEVHKPSIIPSKACSALRKLKWHPNVKVTYAIKAKKPEPRPDRARLRKPKVMLLFTPEQVVEHRERQSRKALRKGDRDGRRERKVWLRFTRKQIAGHVRRKKRAEKRKKVRSLSAEG